MTFNREDIEKSSNSIKQGDDNNINLKVYCFDCVNSNVSLNNDSFGFIEYYSDEINAWIKCEFTYKEPTNFSSEDFNEFSCEEASKFFSEKVNEFSYK